MANTLIDITGQRFGRLVAIRHTAGRWECRCDCGAERRILRHHLIKGHARSCGCLQQELSSKRQRQPIPVPGMRFNRLVVVERLPDNHNRWGKTTLRCRCDCGKETIATATELRQSHKKSCGCARRDAGTVSVTALITHGIA